MRKYWVYFLADFQRILEYRADNIIYTASNIIIPLISLGVWLAISGSGGDLIYSQPELAFYFLMVVWIRSLTSTWFDYFVEDSIYTGNFSKYLIKPFSILEELVIKNISEKIFQTGIVSIIVIVLGYVLLNKSGFTLTITPLVIIAFLLSLIFAIVINMLIDTTIGLTTFWFHDIEFVRSYYIIAQELLSGRIIPLIFLPPILYQIAIYLPFRYTVSFPIEIFLNKMGSQDILNGILMQIVWVLIAFTLYKLVYRKGLYYYQGYGS